MFRNTDRMEAATLNGQLTRSSSLQLTTPGTSSSNHQDYCVRQQRYFY